jgi:UbiD family decarboxylase
MQDLRTWINHMESLGLVRELRGASWELEIGAITDLNAKHNKWVLLFGDIAGYPSGYRLLTGTLLDAVRVGYTLGCDCGSDQQALVRTLRSRLYGNDVGSSEPHSLRPPRETADAPMFENRLVGDDIDLLGFPAPLWHEHDGGRYLGTLDAVVTRDPETDWVNVGAYRLMVHDSRRLCLFVNASHHARLHIEKYASRGERTPIAVSLGHHPSLSMLAGMELAAGVSEYSVVERVRGQPYELVRAPVTGLPVPADSEMVVEGFLSHSTVSEGPYGEFLGYYAGGRMETPTIDVEAIYHRDNAILLGTCAGVPPYDYSYFRCPIRAAMIWEALERAGVSGVCGVWCHEAGYSRALNVVSIKQAYFGHASQAGYVASQVREGVFGGKYTIVVDDDIDPSNLEEVMWAICTRTDPAESIEFVRSSFGMILDPMAQHGAGGALNELSMSRAIIDACRPLRRATRGEFPNVVTVPAHVAEEVARKFADVFDGWQGL